MISLYPKMKLGRWLGVAHRIGQAMVYYVIPKSGVPLARSTVQPFSDEDKRNPAVTAEVTDKASLVDCILGSVVCRHRKDTLNSWFQHF